MKHQNLWVTLPLCALCSVAVRSANDPRPGVDWPSFRGIRASGVADGYASATTWNVPQGKGVKWKTPLAGLGHSSPIVWGDRLCVTTAISGRKDAGLRTGLYGDIESINDDTVHTWKLLCADKMSGRVVVDRIIHEGVPIVKRHTKSTHANSTLATDGTAIVAMLGSEGLFVFEMDGTLRWRKEFGLACASASVRPKNSTPKRARGSSAPPAAERVCGGTNVSRNGSGGAAGSAPNSLRRPVPRERNAGDHSGSFGATTEIGQGRAAGDLGHFLT